MFTHIATKIPEVFLIRPRVYPDERGHFLETDHAHKFSEIGISDVFIQDNHSFSQKGALRGLHYRRTHPQAKLCRGRGEVLDVAVEVRRGPPTFGQWVSAMISRENMPQRYIPVGFAHGFVILSEEADFLYTCSDIYDPAGGPGGSWGDPDLAIEWGVAHPIVSAKDASNPRLSQIGPDRLFEYRR